MTSAETSAFYGSMTQEAKPKGGGHTTISTQESAHLIDQSVANMLGAGKGHATADEHSRAHLRASMPSIHPNTQRIKSTTQASQTARQHSTSTQQRKKKIEDNSTVRQTHAWQGCVRTPTPRKPRAKVGAVAAATLKKCRM